MDLLPLMVVGQFENWTITPKAFANFSPGLERSDNPGGLNIKRTATLKALGMCGANPFRVDYVRNRYPRVVAKPPTLG